MAENRNERPVINMRPGGGGPPGQRGRMNAEKPKDLKGTLSKLVKYIGRNSVLLIALMQLFVRRMPTARLVLVLACVLGLTLGYAKPDAWIARYNVARYQAGALDAIDVEYLGTLSADALPELIALLDSPDESVRTAAAQALDWKRELYCTADEAAPDGFRAWNRSRNAARALLTENSARISALLEGSPER